MAQMPEKRPRAGSAIGDRLTMLYIVGILLTLIAVFAMTIYTNAQLRRQTLVSNQQTIAIENLRKQVNEFQDALESEIQRVLEQRENPPTPAPTETPTSTSKPAPPATTAETSTAERILSELAQIAPRDPATGLRVLGSGGSARSLLTRAGPLASDALPGSTWEELATLALLLDDTATATMLANRAATRGHQPSPRYHETRARRALGLARPREALTAARTLLEVQPERPQARVLAAASEAAAGSPQTASDLLKPLPPTGGLSGDDRLLLAETLARLERWSDVGQVSDGWKPDQAGTLRALNLLRARRAVQAGDPVTGLAIADELLADKPNDSGARLWRAAALVQAGQAVAGGEALSHPMLPIQQPATWYWRGRLALLGGDEQSAREHFQRAVATNRHYAPAWEALAAGMLNGDEPTEALAYLASAIEAAPDRASAHFMQAVIHARSGNENAARQALRTAIELDPALRETAARTEALADLPE